MKFEYFFFFFFSSRRRHTRFSRDWSSDVCSSDLAKLLSFQHHHCDFARALPMVRALREQVDWPQVRRRTSSSPFAEAFLLLADWLGLTGCPPGLDRTEAVPVSAEDSVYTEGRIQRHLAENPDTAELGV